MRGLDETDREILDLLLADARRPFSDIAERVGLSAPAVSDRVDRLQEMGVVRGFTVDVDRSLLRGGVPVLVAIEARPGRAGTIRDAIAGADPVEHVFRTADERVTVTATLPDADVSSLLERQLDFEDIESYDVRILADDEWTPSLGATEFAPDCAECGNSVDAEGERATLDGEPYYFCCGSCEASFVERYESLKQGA